MSSSIVFRDRTTEDDLRTIVREKALFEKKDNVIILPKPLEEPIVCWSREDVSENSHSYDKNNLDDYILNCTKWPMKTDKLCFNCCHSFKGVPIPLPHKYDKIRNIYTCHGNFCSWQCAKAYNINEMPRASRGNRNMNISILAHRMWVKYRKKHHKNKNTNIDQSNFIIEPAPSRRELIVFGGKMSIEEYRKGFFGIVPPDEAVSGKPFLTIRQRLHLPFVDGDAHTQQQSAKQPIGGSHLTQKIGTSKVHQHANDFCERLNKAKKERVILKRTIQDSDKNTLLSSMGVVVKKRR